MERSKLLKELKNCKNKPHQITFKSRVFLEKTCNELKLDFELIEELRELNKINYSHEYITLKNNLQEAYKKYINYVTKELKQKETDSF